MDKNAKTYVVGHRRLVGSHRAGTIASKSLAVGLNCAYNDFIVFATTTP
jgi:hypothetical protein